MSETCENWLGLVNLLEQQACQNCKEFGNPDDLPCNQSHTFGSQQRAEQVALDLVRDSILYWHDFTQN